MWDSLLVCHASCVLLGRSKRQTVAHTHTYALRSVRVIHVWVCARPCLVVFVVVAVVILIVIVVVCPFETHLKFPFRFPHLVVVCVFALYFPFSCPSK